MFKGRLGLGILAASVLTSSFLAGQPPAPGNDNQGRQGQRAPADRSRGFSGPDWDSRVGGYYRVPRATDDDMDDGRPVRGGRGPAAFGGAGGGFGPGGPGAGFGRPACAAEVEVLAMRLAQAPVTSGQLWQR